MHPPSCSRLDLPPAIQPQTLDCGTTDASVAFKVNAVMGPAKVTGPALPARMKKRYDRFRGWVQAELEIEFLLLTPEATQGEIVQ